MTAPQITLEQLQSTAKTVRSEFDGPPLHNCDTLCFRLQDSLRAEYGIPRGKLSVEQWRVGSDGEENHYILAIKPSVVENISSPVWVDLSLDQFCDHNMKAGEVEVSYGSAAEIDCVQVLKPGDSRRDRYESVESFLSRKLE